MDGTQVPALRSKSSPAHQGIDTSHYCQAFIVAIADVENSVAALIRIGGRFRKKDRTEP